MAAPAHTDSLIRQMEAEIEERSALIQGLAQDAQSQERDLNDSELEQIGRAQARITQITKQLDPLMEASKVAIESRKRTELIQQQLANVRAGGSHNGAAVEYRSAGEYIADMYAAKMGDRESQDRLEQFHRVAAHQTTADNPGLLPERIVEGVLNGVDVARPLVSAIGPTNLGQGSWAYARVTQHTQVGEQVGGEKTELASRKMLVTKTSITAPTYGGYVNVSRQDIRRTSPGILDMVINDLAGQYAIETEDACATALETAAVASTVDIPAVHTTLAIAQAVWGAYGQSAAALRTANLPANGPILAVATDRLGALGPLFPPVSPQNAYSTGFGADSLGTNGTVGNLAGLTVVHAPGLTAGQVLFFFRSAVRVFEDRYGAMSVDEPSVWGTQVGYAGDFETVVLGGVIEIEQAV